MTKLFYDPNRSVRVEKEVTALREPKIDSLKMLTEDRMTLLETSNEENMCSRSILKKSPSLSVLNPAPSGTGCLRSTMVAIGESTNDTCSSSGSHTPSTPSLEGTHRRVTFDTVSIRKYGMEIGDNPSCSYGPPVQLSWKFEEGVPLDINAYEKQRGPRRSEKHMYLNYYQRRETLLALGFTEKELKEAERQVAKIQRQRGVTYFFLPLSKIEEAIQSARRKIRRVLR